MFVKILLLLALGALTYWVVYVLPKKVSRTVIVLGTLLIIFLLGALNTWKPNKSVIWIAVVLYSLQMVAAAGFMTQASHYLIEEQVRWHRENNFTNLHRFPISILEYHHEKVKKWVAGFWFILLLYIISGGLIWAH